SGRQGPSKADSASRPKEARPLRGNSSRSWASKWRFADEKSIAAEVLIPQKHAVRSWSRTAFLILYIEGFMQNWESLNIPAGLNGLRAQCLKHLSTVRFSQFQRLFRITQNRIDRVVFLPA